MPIRRVLIYCCIALINSCVHTKDSTVFPLTEASATVLLKKDKSLFQYWELKDHHFLEDYNLGELPSLESYKDSVSNEIGKSAMDAQIMLESKQLENIKHVEKGLENHELIHRGSVGNIRKINFIESQILNFQITRFPLFTHPTEFHAFFMTNDSHGVVRVYFAASDQPWPPKATPLIVEIEKLLTEGWHLTSHLHNHYESKSNKYIGMMSASLADVHYFKILKQRFNLPEAKITNGFHTLIIDAKDFETLNSH